MLIMLIYAAEQVYFVRFISLRWTATDQVVIK